MKATSFTNIQENQIGNSFDLFRLSHAKQVVDICSNTLRQYNKQGLRFYRQGKARFVSKSELAAFIRFGATKGML